MTGTFPVPLARDDSGRWHYRRSLASRVILLTTVAVGLAVAFVALGAFLTVRMQMQSTLDDSLLNRARKAASSEALARIQVANNFEVPSWALGAADIRLTFVTPDRLFTPDQDSPQVHLNDPEVAVAKGTRPYSIRTIQAGPTTYRVVAVPAGEGQALMLAQSLEPQKRVLARLGAVMLLFGLAGVIAAAAAGWAVARNGLRPVRRLTGAVEEIARTEDLRPLPIEGDDEIARLATAFNQMLGALAASRDRQRRLVADAGHELRTPLALLRTELELALRHAGTFDELREAVQRSLGEVERLGRLADDLLLIARSDRGKLELQLQSVPAKDVLATVASRFEWRAQEAGRPVHVLPGPEIRIRADRIRLEQALGNLVDNALRHGSGEVRLRSAGLDGLVELHVTDEGVGIPPAFLDQAFDRFSRGDSSRHGSGSGLGLSIVAVIAAAHGGSAHIANREEGGTDAWLALPA